MSDPIRSISQNNYLLSNGGGGHEYSGANGVYVDNVNEVIGLETSASNAIETVIENSGAWGGAGLPISAGPGIKVGLENGVLNISNDETVLFDNSNVGYSASFTLSEPLSAFDRFRVYGRASSDGETFNSCMEQEPVSGGYISYNGTYLISNGYPVKYMLGYSASNDLTYSIVRSRREWTTPDGTSWGCMINPTADSEKPKNGFIYKIVGIGRKSN